MISNNDIKESDLFIRYLERETNETENSIVENWIEFSQENRDYFDDVKEVWKMQLQAKAALDEKYQTNDSWAEISKNINTKSTKTISLFVKRLAIAASFLIVIGLGFLFWNIRNNQTEIIITTSNEIKKFELPDKSVVWMNRNSKITYKNNFESKRTLTFSGEGYFEVQANPQNPFEITTSKTTITVVGTKFNVNCEDSISNVTVFEGKVRMKASNLQNEILLVAGEKGFCNSKNIISKQSNIQDANVLSWKTNDLKFNNSNIVEVVAILEKTFQVNIKLEIENTKNCSLSGNFTKPTLDEMLEVLREILGITSIKNGDVIILKGTGC